MKCLSLCLLLLVLLHGSSGRKSEFNKKINITALEEGFDDDEEDDGWHEDTHEWKEKMREKKRKAEPQIDFSNIKDGKLDKAQMAKLMAGGGGLGGLGGGGGGSMKVIYLNVALPNDVASFVRSDDVCYRGDQGQKRIRFACKSVVWVTVDGRGAGESIRCGTRLHPIHGRGRASYGHPGVCPQPTRDAFIPLR
jgi:hypothetical protein